MLIERIAAALLCLTLAGLSACSFVSDNTAEVEKDLADYTSSTHMLDGVDAAYDTDYSKFTLPDKNALHITQPEGVYALTLEYANKQNSDEWKTERVLKLQEIFGTDYGSSVNTSNGSAVLGDPDRACVGIGISDAYAFWEWNGETVCPFNRSSLDSIETLTISDKTKKDMPAELLDDIDKSIKLGADVKAAIGEDLDAMAYDAYIFKSRNGTGYGVEMQKAYKGIGILNLQYANMNNTDYDGDNALLNMAMQVYTYFDEKNELLYYRSCDSFKVQEARNIESVVSFKGACDILEKELGDNAKYEFDDVVLMYEPRGKYIGETFDGNATVKCTPKWYFIKYTIDTNSGQQHQIRFFSVDCETGALEAQW